MTKEDIKKSVLTGIVGGITAAVTILVLLWAYIFITDWYKDYKQQQEAERIASIPPDNRSGDYCPESKVVEPIMATFFIIIGLINSKKQANIIHIVDFSLTLHPNNKSE